MAQEIMSTEKFSSLPLVPFLIDTLKTKGIETMTKVQQLAIPQILAGNDVAVKAKTGSGKSFAFLVPAIDLIYRGGMKPRNGTGVIILAPTRELALQIYAVAQELAGNFVSVALSVGGMQRQKEVERLANGASLLVATPGRLIDHLQNSLGFKVSNLFMMIFDEADLLLDMGFEEEVALILKLLPNGKDRQTCLFSATLSDRVMNMKNLKLRANAVRLDADDASSSKTRMEFEQGYLLCPLELKFLTLYTFIKRKNNVKAIIFMSTCAAVQFYAEFLRYVGLQNVLAINGSLKQSQRTKVYDEFTKLEKGVLIATNIAARGLDIPDVDYIIQYDPPDSVESYIHRAGRACRGATIRKGVGILFLSTHEMPFIQQLNEQGVPLSEIEFPISKLLNIQKEMETVLKAQMYLMESSIEAFRMACTSYNNHQIKKIFDFKKLDKEAYAKSFGLTYVPSLPFEHKKPQSFNQRRNSNRRSD